MTASEFSWFRRFPTLRVRISAGVKIGENIVRTYESVSKLNFEALSLLIVLKLIGSGKNFDLRGFEKAVLNRNDEEVMCCVGIGLK